MSWFWGVVVAVSTGVAIAVLSAQITWWFQRRTQKEEEHSRLKSLLTLFSREAGYLHGRWLQYYRQAASSDLSFSRPFELTDGNHVAEFIRLGGSGETLEALFMIKQLNSNVMAQVVRAQKQFARAEKAIVNNVEMVVDLAPFRTFGVAAAFIRDDWNAATKAVGVVLQAAEAAGVETTDLAKELAERERAFGEVCVGRSSPGESAPRS